MKLYFKYLLILLKSQMQYRTSFWLLFVGQFFVPFFAFAGIYFMFERFGNIRGWSFFEAAVCFAVIHMAFTLSDCFVRGFDSFSSLVVNGGFDRVLIRPRGTVVQVLGSQFDFSKAGRLVQSGGVLAWAVINLSIKWNIFKIITLILMVFSGVFIFAGILILTAALCFWTIEGLEVMNIFNNGGREMAQYPLNIYKKWIVQFFTFIIPFGTVNYLPLLYLLGRTSNNDVLYMMTPIFGMVFIIPCLAVWRIGVRHYRSTGS